MSQSSNAEIAEQSEHGNTAFSAGHTSVQEAQGADDRSARRAALRRKFEQYLHESKSEDNNARYDEALERLRNDPEADGFNLVCRTKGDQKTGLIILNRLSGRTRRTEPQPVEEPEPEPEQEPVETTPVMERPQAVPPSPRIQRMIQPKVRRAPRPNPRKEASEAQMVALANKVDALWRQLDHMKAKHKEKKLSKAAERSMKELLSSKKDDKESRGPAATFYDRLDQAAHLSTAGSPSRKALFKMF